MNHPQMQVNETAGERQMVNVFDMASGELLFQEHSETRRVDRRHQSADPPAHDHGYEVLPTDERDRHGLSPDLELQLLPVE